MFIYPRIRDLREDNDWTQEHVAEILGEHLTTYRRWETGEREMPAHIIKALCEIYNVSADYIFGFTDNCTSLSDIRQ